MSDFQAIADRVEIEALRGEYVDAVMMHDYDRLASLFTDDGAVRMPHIPAEAVGRDAIRAGVERLQGQLEYFVQATHPGAIRLDGDAASGRAYISELMHGRDGSSHVEPCRLSRPLPAHPGRLEVHRTDLRGQVRRYLTAGRLGTRYRRERALTPKSNRRIHVSCHRPHRQAPRCRRRLDRRPGSQRESALP